MSLCLYCASEKRGPYFFPPSWSALLWKFSILGASGTQWLCQDASPKRAAEFSTCLLTHSGVSVSPLRLHWASHVMARAPESLAPRRQSACRPLLAPPAAFPSSSSQSSKSRVNEPSSSLGNPSLASAFLSERAVRDIASLLGLPCAIENAARLCCVALAWLCRRASLSIHCCSSGHPRPFLSCRPSTADQI